jgi:hypothetical protein
MTTDVASALIAKSDQLNADDLLGGPIIIEITKVTNLGKGKEQPLVINYRGDDGKPWKACKTMGRVMAQAWGTTDGNVWLGRKVRLYRDPSISFGKNKNCGGIRICHENSISHIDGPMDIIVTETRGHKAPYRVEPLIVREAAPAENIDTLKNAGRTEAGKGKDALKAWWSGLGGVKQNQLGAPFLEELKGIASKPAPDATSDLPDDGYSDNRE